MSPKPSRPSKNKETHYNKPDKPAGPSRAASGGYGDKKERTGSMNSNKRFEKDSDSERPFARKSSGDKEQRAPRTRKPVSEERKRSYDDKDQRSSAPRERKPYSDDRKSSSGDREQRSSSPRERKPYSDDRKSSFGDRERRSSAPREKRPYSGREESGGSPGDRKSSSGDRKRPYSGREESSSSPRERKSFSDDRGKRSFGDRDQRASGSREDRPFRKEGGERPYSSGKRMESGEGSRERSAFKKPYRASSDDSKRPFPRESRDGDRPSPRGKREDGDRPYQKREGSERGEGYKKEGGRPERSGEKRPYADRSKGSKKPFPKEGRSGERSRPPEKREGAERKPYSDKGKPSGPPKRDFEDEDFYEDERPFLKSGKWNEEAKAGPMTLNKYLAHSGISSRRETAALVKEGKVKVNGKVVMEPGYRVQPNDVVTMDDKKMTPQRHLVYILLNKPKDFLTTTEDDRGRRTVMDLVANAGVDRLYPVGRLDRNTTGVLLMTNDGDLAQKLAHPSFETKKIYQVTLDKDLTKNDFDKIVEGVQLEDGIAHVDRLAYLEKKHEIGLEIHSGRNRIVRRIFEALDYKVEKLDRVVYAGLTKKNVSRGKWRFLSEKEVILLKHFKH